MSVTTLGPTNWQKPLRRGIAYSEAIDKHNRSWPHIQRENCVLCAAESGSRKQPPWRDSLGDHRRWSWRVWHSSADKMLTSNGSWWQFSNRSPEAPGRLMRWPSRSNILPPCFRGKPILKTTPTLSWLLPLASFSMYLRKADLAFQNTTRTN